MAWTFGDGFDCYAVATEATTGFWDTTSNSNDTLYPGRFPPGNSIFAPAYSMRFSSNTNCIMTKTSGVNDAVHHVSVAFRQEAAISGTFQGLFIQFIDGSTNQVCIVFRSDGAILLTSATPGGTVLDTYTGAFTAQNVWYHFEFEVVIHNTTGSWAVRKNGSTSNSWSKPGMNTRPGTNAYANKLTLNVQTSGLPQLIDDFLWRSDASSLPWLGDVRCVTRTPATDASVQFSRSGLASVGFLGSFQLDISNTQAIFTSVIATVSGTVSQINLHNLRLDYTGNIKCTVFNSMNTIGQDHPGLIVSSGTTLVNPRVGMNTITFPTPFTVVKGLKYWVGFMADTALTGGWNVSSGSSIYLFNTTYAAFPTMMPTGGSYSSNPVSFAMLIVPTTNYAGQGELRQTYAGCVAYSSTVNNEDFYTISPGLPGDATTLAVIARAYMQKSDSGTRTSTVQVKSGGTTVAGNTVALTATTAWVWAFRTMETNPATGSAWTNDAVDALQVGPKVVS